MLPGCPCARECPRQREDKQTRSGAASALGWPVRNAGHCPHGERDHQLAPGYATGQTGRCPGAAGAAGAGLRCVPVRSSPERGAEVCSQVPVGAGVGAPASARSALTTGEEQYGTHRSPHTGPPTVAIRGVIRLAASPLEAGTAIRAPRHCDPFAGEPADSEAAPPANARFTSSPGREADLHVCDGIRAIQGAEP